MSYIAVQPVSAKPAPCPRCLWAQSRLVAIVEKSAMRECEACGTKFTDRALASELHEERLRKGESGRTRKRASMGTRKR